MKQGAKKDNDLYESEIVARWNAGMLFAMRVRQSGGRLTRTSRNRRRLR